jgi:hypothetical protein
VAGKSRHATDNNTVTTIAQLNRMFLVMSFISKGFELARCQTSGPMIDN